MKVYVESNYALELARRQEEVAEASEILKLAEERRIELIYPAIALTEPFSTMLRYKHERSKALESLNHQLNDLARSQPHRPLLTNMAPLVATLTNLAKDETDLLEQAVGQMLRVGRSLPLTFEVFDSALAAETNYDLSPQDSIVFASIIQDLDKIGSAPDESCFLSKNSKDFYGTRREFENRNCHYLSKFSAGLAFIRAKI